MIMFMEQTFPRFYILLTLQFPIASKKHTCILP